jgi:hypothetical protein
MTRTFTADTEDKAAEMAKEYMRTVDPYEQPHIAYWGENSEGEYYVTVKTFGLD